jgi:predicted ArsR family transcriptional regulator
VETSYLEAVADPVRLRLARHLAEHGSGSLAELAKAADVHPNTARIHLAALQQAGVVSSHSERLPGRGRPRTTYRLVRGWTPGGSGFRGLAELMSAAVLRSGVSERELRELGAEWGRYLLGRPEARDPKTELPRILEELGFQATVTRGELRLSGCPCPIVAPDHPELVCGLADAVVEGVLAGTGSRLRLAGIRHDPEGRVCRGSLRKAA